ncbi:hypothetical protein Patl1_15741 [Pistacia atlantica]|uniref:Uncharacterized protein n=1 Tax=Pistacia atlantica TaxID=434234 RepID=A0ACC1BAE8_9ROSI|nr:hypothetical protein Patl1_15741 [Pistacia atlantica]
MDLFRASLNTSKLSIKEKGLSNGIDINHTTKEPNSLIADSHVRGSTAASRGEKRLLALLVDCRQRITKQFSETWIFMPNLDPLAGFSREISGEDMPDESKNGFVNCVSPCLGIVRTMYLRS